MLQRSRARATAAIVIVGVAACSDIVESPMAESAGGPANFGIFIDCAEQTSIPETECEALFALYYSTTGEGWSDNTGWLTADPCDWYGITCSGGSVRFLVLTGNQLEGSIPAELAGLTNLQWLVLNQNRLSGSIPGEIGNLGSLLVLDLSANQLTGGIPPALGDLGSLVDLLLIDNQLSGPVPPEIGDLELGSLAINVNQLSGQVPLPVAELGGRIQDISAVRCHFEENPSLFMPATPAYEAADLDHDGVICEIELGADTDGDGIADALDPDGLADFLETIPDAAFRSGDGGHRTAMRSRLADIEQDIADGDIEQAIRGLENLRRHVDGCGTAADMNDWISDCSEQVVVRDWIDTLITNLGG